MCTQHVCAPTTRSPPRPTYLTDNPLNRLAEEELIPTLHAHGCSFIAFNPLAAGLLSGAHRAGNEAPAGRFKDNPNCKRMPMPALSRARFCLRSVRTCIDCMHLKSQHHVTVQRVRA